MRAFSNHKKMKKLVLFIFLISFCVSCDPVSSMDANIKNSTSNNFSIVFASSISELNKILELEPSTTGLFQDGFSTTGSVLEPSLIDYDSVYIMNDANEILKLYKPGTEGKNIFNIETYWSFREPSKRFYKYQFDIRNEDIE